MGMRSTRAFAEVGRSVPDAKGCQWERPEVRNAAVRCFSRELSPDADKRSNNIYNTEHTDGDRVIASLAGFWGTMAEHDLLRKHSAGGIAGAPDGARALTAPPGVRVSRPRGPGAGSR